MIRRAPVRLFRSVLAAFALFSAVSGDIAHAQTQPPASMGFVVTSFFTAIHESKTLDECPAGLAATNDQIWWRSLAPKDRVAPTHDGDLEPAARARASSLRGPHGEDVCWNPTSVQDPPLRTVQGRLSYGINLDGTSDGHQTANSCGHEKFTGPDNEPGIDNQLYRVLGCIHGWRADGYIETNANSDRLNNSRGTMMIEVTGTHGLPLDGNVTVGLYKAADSLPKDSKGGILPYASYRIDDIPIYGATLHGTVKDGLLVTEPTDVRIPYFGNNQETNFLIRGMRLRLRIDPVTGTAAGLVAGYQDVDNLWDYIRKAGFLMATGHFDCPAVYQAMHQLADGYRNAQTGECTALSAAYRIEAVPAFIIHPDSRTLVPDSTSAALSEGTVNDADAAMPWDVGFRSTTTGRILTTATGMTLYAKGDATDPSACSGACLADRQPLRAPELATGHGDWSVARRPEDKTAQWSFKGAPLYVFSKDVHPGDVFGATQADWHAIIVQGRSPLPGWMTVRNTDVGRIVADARGHTLYILNGSLDDILKQICDRACIDSQWLPVQAEPDAQPAGDWQLLPADGAGKRQWSFQGKPVYLFKGDSGPGMIGGNHFGGASVGARNYWSVISELSVLRGMKH
jgi:predicted lipoprotein with Yx(FWY)xxD motif